MKVTGNIEKILEVETGESQAGKAWKKVTFILKTSEEYNNIYAFEIFGEEKVDKFIKWNEAGKSVDVDFNVSCNEWKGKYYTSLQAWKVYTSEKPAEMPQMEGTATAFDGLGF
tara:strand:+ start:460 stop:798 length:339 start_codon:yes stop_codon:yes gene_type:complete